MVEIPTVVGERDEQPDSPSRTPTRMTLEQGLFQGICDDYVKSFSWMRFFMTSKFGRVR